LIVSGGYIHLRVKEASGRLYDSDSLIVDRNRNQHAFAVLQNDNELQAEALRMQVGGEGVGNRLLGARWDLDRIAPRREVADDARLAVLLRDERAANNGDANGSGLLVGDRQAGGGGMAIDELGAEDLRLGE
jgi:hypothetical protein